MPGFQRIRPRAVGSGKKEKRAGHEAGRIGHRMYRETAMSLPRTPSIYAGIFRAGSCDDYVCVVLSVVVPGSGVGSRVACQPSAVTSAPGEGA